MNFRKRLFLFLPIFLLAQHSRADSHIHEADVVIYGATSAGIVAAVQLSRLGKTSILIEPSNHLGGLTTGGLGWTDSGRKSAIGGVSREFYERIHKHYSNPKAWKFGKPEELNADRGAGKFNPDSDTMWVFEPKVAMKIYRQMIAECGDDIELIMRQRLDRDGAGVTMENGRITEIRAESGERYRGKIFIDATYEGDLMAAARVPYHVGRESNETYDETLNGVQLENRHNHKFIVKVDPYKTPGDPKSGLVWGISPEKPGEDGSGDRRVQAYCFRMCMSLDPENRVPFPKPDGYDETMYELLFRNFEAGDLRIPIAPGMMPNGKTDTNNNYAFSTDNIGMNYDYPDADYATRERIIAQHELYQKGLMWTLQNHERVPQEIRDHFEKWGLPKDEFTETSGWPPQLYIREARRMVSGYIITENDCRRGRVCEDSVGLGSYNMDSHNCQRYVTADGAVQNEGDVQVSPGGPYAISYRAIIPRKSDVKNLFVPVCLSSTHIAFGSIRMEPVFMILGHSSATAASMAIDARIAVQDVDYAKLEAQLIEEGQVVDLPPDAKPHLTIKKTGFKGIVIDDTEAKLTGHWTDSTSARNFVGVGYKHDGAKDQGKKSAVYSVALEKAGKYEVRFSYTPSTNRGTNVPVTVVYGDTKIEKQIDQRKT
ncbi:MAG: FAD-dependent oxidoreductase, partial [Verrucomicrobiales bacterium]|nr:FAD-dependent oxidoreductase [Verrucomicrobiales bacterium]